MRTTAIFDFWRKKEKTKGLTYAPTMNGNTPFYAPFGDSIYASDIIVQSIRCKANEFKKLEPRHIRSSEGAQTSITDSSIARVLKRPNAYMSTADFLEKITILLELNKNVFIYPAYYMTVGGEKVYTELYPLKPSSVEYLTNDKGELFIHFRFANGYETTLPNSDIIHWRKDYGVNDYFGGGMFGGDDNSGLFTMLQRYDQLTQSIAKALEVSCQVNAIIKYNSYVAEDGYEDERIKFENEIKNSKSGVIITDLVKEFTPLPRDTKLVDSETLKFFYDTILRANGCSLAILNGDYTKAQKEAYYEHALEGDIKSLGQAFSRVLFSDREAAYGNEIVFYPNDISFMSMENKIAALQTGLPAGIFTKDEARALLGYAPLPNGAGQAVPQGYNSLLNENNNNTLQSNNDNTDDGQRSVYIENVEHFYRYNPNHDKYGRFAPKGGSGGGSSGGGSKGGSGGNENSGTSNSLYKGKEGRNYGTANTDDAMQEIKNGKHNSLENYMDENGNLTPERAALHKKIIDEYLEGKTPVEGQAEMRMMGGGPASGKSSVIESGLVKEMNPKQSVKVDPDDIKTKLPGYSEMCTKSTDAAPFYHEESSMIAKQLANVSFNENYNVTYDGTGDGSEASVMKKINGARDKGYKVTATYVTIDTNEALKRNTLRYEKAKAQGKNPRKVPDDYVINCHSEVTRISMKCADKFDEIKLYDNNGPTGAVKLIATGGNGKGLTAIAGMEAEFAAFVNK